MTIQNGINANANTPLPKTGGGTGVNAPVANPTAGEYVAWDSDNNVAANNMALGYATTVTAAGTTVLTVASAAQQYFTGSTTQTVTMPVASTCRVGQTWLIVNNSSGIVTVQSSGANSIIAMPANTNSTITCILNSGTSAASWNAENTAGVAGVNTITGTANQVIANQPSGAVILSLPQSIAATSSPTFNALTLTSVNFGSTVLSAYETGTFNPTVSANTPGDLSISYATRYGVYQRIGNTVHYFIYLSFTPTYTTASGNILITSFPIATVSTTNTVLVGVGGAGFTATASATGYIFTPNSTTASGAVLRSALTAANLNITSFATAANSVIAMQGSYTV